MYSLCYREKGGWMDRKATALLHYLRVIFRSSFTGLTLLMLRLQEVKKACGFLVRGTIWRPAPVFKRLKTFEALGELLHAMLPHLFLPVW